MRTSRAPKLLSRLPCLSLEHPIRSDRLGLDRQRTTLSQLRAKVVGPSQAAATLWRPAKKRHQTPITLGLNLWRTKGQAHDLGRLLMRLQVAMQGASWSKIGPVGANWGPRRGSDSH